MISPLGAGVDLDGRLPDGAAGVRLRADGHRTARGNRLGSSERYPLGHGARGHCAAYALRRGLRLDYDQPLGRSALCRPGSRGHDPVSRTPRSALSAGRESSTHSTSHTRGLFGRVAEGLSLEVINWRTVVSGPAPMLELTSARRWKAGWAPWRSKGGGPSILRRCGEYRATPVYDRYQLAPGADRKRSSDRRRTRVDGRARTVSGRYRRRVRQPHRQDVA